ncbi:MAG: hypothetical protein RR386_05545 [Bacteroidaceae bacterium]
MKHRKITLDLIQDIPALEITTEGKLRGGFSNLNVSADENSYTNEKCKNQPCKNKGCKNNACSNKWCTNKGCKNKDCIPKTSA